LKRTDEEIVGNFDDAEQVDDVRDEMLRLATREGIDVRDVNRLARHYREVFQKELPHPKMDALVKSLKTAWTAGKKSLIFVRRVKSVDELKRKLDEQYDDWLIRSLRERLPESVRAHFEQVVGKYEREKRQALASLQERDINVASVGDTAESGTDDRGGTDTFFAWFFR